MNKFSKREALKFGWDAALENVSFFIVSLLAVWIAGLVLSSIASGFHRNDVVIIGVLFSLAAAVIRLIGQIGFVKVSLKLQDKQKPVKEDFYPTSKQFWNFLGACILFGIAVMVGLVLLIVPGIILGVSMQFYSYYVIEKGMGPIEALKASFKATEGQRWEIFKFDLVCAGVGILGALALGIGLFVAIPTVLVANAFVYRKLSAA